MTILYNKKYIKFYNINKVYDFINKLIFYIFETKMSAH